MKNPLKPILIFFTLLAVISFLANNAISQEKIIDAQTRGINLKEQPEWKTLGIVGFVNMPGADGDGKPSDDKDNVINCLGVIDDNGKISTQIKNDLKTKKYNCLKISLGYKFKGYASDKSLIPVYKIADQKDIPVVFDFGDSSQKDESFKFGPPLHLDEVAVANRNVDFVISRCGNPWIQDAAQVAYKNKNVFLECSAFLTGDIDKMDVKEITATMVDPLKWVYYYIENPQRIMYGSDYPNVKGDNLKTYLQYYKGAIPPAARQRVFYENAVCLYKLYNNFIKDNNIIDTCKEWRRQSKVKSQIGRAN